MQFPSEDFKTGDPVLDTDMRGDISFNNVTFSYIEGEVALDGISFTIPYGKTTAIIGHSGSGKSTIFKLLERLYDPDSGEVTIGGKPLSRFNLKEWRDKVGYGTQDAAVFSGSLRDNVMLGIERDVSEAEFTKACDTALVSDFAKNLPNGFHTIVEEYGKNFSGGQKQRIAIARALLSNSQIMLLDEPTTSLDPVAENSLRKSLKSALKGKTSVIIAHEIATIIDADQIILLNHGKVEAVGTHKVLMNESTLYNTYFEARMFGFAKGELAYE
jgi:ATP-binding cassette subfamily B protein AbcA/BmrA